MPQEDGPVGLRVLPNGYQMVSFSKHLLPIGGVLRFQANYKISTRYAPLAYQLVVAAKIKNEFRRFRTLFHQFLHIETMKNCRKFSLLDATK